MSAEEPCCEQPQLQWESRQIVDRFADVLACRNCRRTHKVEDWAISLILPQPDRCVNCGDPMSVDSSRSRHGLPERVARCEGCGMSSKDARKLHGKLARLHPSGEYMAAAEAAQEGGRGVLAFKLCTAHLAYVADWAPARAMRIRGLETLGLIEQALSEAWSWYDDGAPSEVLSIIAGLEAARGNLDGTIDALERGLRVDPQNLAMWTDYAEIQAHFDDREGALVSASYGLGVKELAPRCLEVIAQVAERYYAEDQMELALDAVNRAGTAKQESESVAWLTARIAARLRQWEESQAWLEVTLRLNPEHRFAREALDRIKPRDSRKGWFGWLGGGNGRP